MIWLRYIPSILAAGALAGGIGYVWALKRSNARLASENAALSRSIASLTLQAEQSAEARKVEGARAERWRVRAEDLSGQIETILTGDFTDATLDPDLADFINSLREAGD